MFEKSLRALRRAFGCRAPHPAGCGTNETERWLWSPAEEIRKHAGTPRHRREGKMRENENKEGSHG
ncbi:hypothetical protein TDMWS_20170 [Thermodesulfomicrobium sp. WS]|nr:hypothetical protein TDMWS_20170 [Thermodesulfomicrobium sp. WS]